MEWQPSEKSLSHFRAKMPSIRSKHPLSIRSGRTQPSYISTLEQQLNDERKVSRESE